MIFFRIILLGLMLIGIADAAMFQSIRKHQGTFIQKGKSKDYCASCGMNLHRYYKTNHIYAGHQYCSLHCLYKVTKGKEPHDCQAVDAKTLKLIDAHKAYYIVGSEMRGTMTRSSKYAFALLDDAKLFSAQYGGRIMDFAQAYKAAGKDFKRDNKMMQIKKEKKVYKDGKKLYAGKCKEMNLKQYSSIAELKAALSENCSKIRTDRAMQSIAVYLWEVKRNSKILSSLSKIRAPHDAKCPICGMFVHKYPKWISLILSSHKSYFFDGPKDMFKYYIAHKKKMPEAIVSVTDYFSGKKVNARKAYYVMGSNIYGPMGNELVPFRSELDANVFRRDHFGMKILNFQMVIEDKEVMEDLEDL